MNCIVHTKEEVNWKVHGAMNYFKATDELFSAVTAEEFAKEIGVSISSVKKSRMKDPQRPPPQGWEAAALRIAEKRIAYFTKLAAKLRTI
jgi:hypothetical protein